MPKKTKNLNPPIDVEYVEAELVEQLPDKAAEAIPIMELPDGATAAPSPAQLKRGNRRIFNLPADMEKAALDYFYSILGASQNESTGELTYFWRRPPTVPGLARALGMSDRALRNYAHRDGFSEVVEWAKDIIREQLETEMHQPGNRSGAIFAAKNLGYTDHQQINIYAPPTRLEAAKSTEEIAKLIEEDVV